MNILNSFHLPRLLLVIVVSGMACAGEFIKVPVTEKEVAALPKGSVIEGPLPRQVLIVNLQERGEFPGSRTVSSYWVFDPAFPEKSLRKIFTGPGQGQYLRFMTPLFGGYGLASGRLDPEKEPERDGPWFWFNPLEGKVGPNIDVDMWQERMNAGSFVGEHVIHGKESESISRIVRYDPLKAVVRTTEMEFYYLNWLNNSEVLGVAKLKDGEREVRLDVEKSEYEVIGNPPPCFGQKDTNIYRFTIIPAGKKCRDGIYAINDFSLYFLPTGGEWHTVIHDVHIVKTFGGAPPRLPVIYVGNGRFAVAKTVKDKVKVPKTTLKHDAIFGAAEAVTMLIDGTTGEVHKQSKPYIYNQNPEPQIPDDWWAVGLKPKPTEPEIKVKTHFHWDEKRHEIRYAGDKVMKLGEDDERAESGDGRHLLIYQKCPRGGGNAKTKVPFRILNGETGRIHSAEVVSDFYEVWVEATWEVLCGESPDPETLKNFQDSGPVAE